MMDVLILIVSFPETIPFGSKRVKMKASTNSSSGTPCCNPREIAIAVAVVMSLAHLGSAVGPMLTGYMQESLGSLQLSMRIISFSPITLVIAAVLIGQGTAMRSK